MKEFIKNKTVTYNLMSFTGFKALVLFSLLSQKPYSYNEICEYFLNHPYLKEKISLDTLRVYLTSMKRVGCIVKRERINGISKYYISSNPFKLEISNEQINSLIKIYKIAIKKISIEELYSIEHFMNKLSKTIKNPEILNNYYKISLLKGINLELLKTLNNCANKKEQIVIEYNSPRSGHKDINISTDEIIIKNNKVYLYGVSEEYNQMTGFLINRIIKIKEIKMFKDKNLILKPMTVGIEYYGEISELNITENIKIINTDDKKSVIEITYPNEFYIRQYILELKDKAKIIYPISYKQQFIGYLQKMKAVYDA